MNLERSAISPAPETLYTRQVLSTRKGHAMSEPQYLEIGAALGRRIAYRRRPGAGPEIVWLGGFRSDMLATKASALDEWAVREGRAFTRFDYSGHGESAGNFADGTISLWLEDALAVLQRLVQGPAVLVGSSMGGWLALLAAQRLAGGPRAVAGMVLIAPAVDFTEKLMWDQFPEDVRHQIIAAGQWLRPTPYGPEPQPITRALIEDGRNHALMGRSYAAGCPIHILQGMADPDVPWPHVMAFMEHLAQDDVTLTLIKDGDHRLSRPQDLLRLIAAVSGLVGAV